MNVIFVTGPLTGTQRGLVPAPPAAQSPPVRPRSRNGGRFRLHRRTSRHSCGSEHIPETQLPSPTVSPRLAHAEGLS